MDNLSSREINITYETLYELLRREKSKEELQKLDESFFRDVIDYLREKQSIAEDNTKNDIFSFSEKEKTAKQLENIKKILRELYEKREKKIIDTAINKSRTKSDIINTTNMLAQERHLFSSVVEVLDKFRADILISILNLVEPKADSSSVLNAGMKEPFSAEPGTETGHKEQMSAEKKTKFLKFLKPVEQFVGRELEIYGPFQPQDKAYLPSDIADILISQKSAVELEEG